MDDEVSPQDPDPSLDDLVVRARKEAAASAGTAGPMRAIAFFDLSGSTAAKLQVGNAAASQDALTFTSLAALVSARSGGQVVKSLGDGALAMFDDAMDACRAALDLRHATHEVLRLRMTAGMTVGRPHELDLGDGRLDVLGDVVDRAARIQSLAIPGQVLMDAAMYHVVRGHVAGVSEWQVDTEPRRAHAKGIGRIDLYEVALPAHWPLKNKLATPFEIIKSGRPSLDEKLALIRDAKTEIIEIGIGLTSFAQYFTGQKPAEFRDPIRRLVRGGVNLRCFALDTEHQAGLDWLMEQGNRTYLDEARFARERLEAEARHYEYEDYRGRLEYHTYRRVPEFWCLGVDVEDPVYGRMFYAPYLMDVSRSENPVFQVSRTSDNELYSKFLASVQAVRRASDESAA
jgi:class 3 adenylate cyclase